MKPRSFLTLLLWLPLYFAIGQTLTNIRASLDNASGSISVSYDLEGRPDRYRVDLYCSMDSGKTFTESLIGVSGDVGYNVLPGRNKRISWAYFIDMPDFTGKNVVFKVSAREDIEFKENTILSLGGPEKFYKSILVPGLGNTHVRHKKNYYWVTGLVYGLLGTGTYFHYKGQSTYAAYKNSTSASEAITNFNNAEKYGNLSSALLTTGFTLWTVDVLQVIIKGKSNRKKQAKILERRGK